MSQINRTAFILYIALTCFFPLGVLVRFTPVVNFNIYPQDVIVCGIFLLTLFSYFKNKKKHYKTLFYSITIFNVIAILSLVINIFRLDQNELFVSFSYLIRLDAYISLLFIGLFGFSKYRTRILGKLFMIASCLFIIFGFAQYFFYNNLRNLYYLGWDEHLYRLFSTFLDPNFAGVLFVLIALVFLGKILDKNSHSAASLMVDIALIIASVLAIILTYSRTALIALFASGLFFLTIRRKIKLLVISVVVLLTVAFLVSDFSVEGMNPIRIASSEARIHSMNEAVDIFTDSPIYGIGFNAYRYYQQDKGFRKDTLSISSNADAGTDNSFLFILATTGIIGFIAYLNIWFVVLKKISKKGPEKSYVSYAIIIALFTGSLFVNALFYAPIMLWVFLYLGRQIDPDDNYSL